MRSSAPKDIVDRTHSVHCPFISERRAVEGGPEEGKAVEGGPEEGKAGLCLPSSLPSRVLIKITTFLIIIKDIIFIIILIITLSIMMFFTIWS